MEDKILFFNQSVPFTCQVEGGGLIDGMIITVCGCVPPETNRFQVDLQYGYDIALHVNFRYDGSACVVHNTRQNNKWGSEERKYETPFPRGQLFSLQILVTQESYKISTNGKPFSEYKHRIPFFHVNSISVGGTVELNLVAFQNLEPYQTGALRPFMVPYKSIINGGLQCGKAIIIQGVLNHDVKRLEINLRHKTGIAFFYRVCFDENMVVHNTYEDGIWGDEERSEGIPLKRGQRFHVTIYCSHDHYVVFVNGNQAHTYKHRYTNQEDIDVLEISGNLRLTFVQP